MSALAVERCNFIGRYTNEEYGPYVESAQDDSVACQAQLAKRFPKSAEVVLFNLDHLYEEKDVVQQGEQWLPASKQWPPQLRARLLAKLANYDDAKADDYALQAVRLDENVTIAPARLGRAWLNAGQPTKAAEAIEDMVDSDYAPYHALRFDIALARKDWPAAVATIDASDTSQLYPNLKRFGQLAVAAPSTLLVGPDAADVVRRDRDGRRSGRDSALAARPRALPRRRAPLAAPRFAGTATTRHLVACVVRRCARTRGADDADGLRRAAIARRRRRTHGAGVVLADALVDVRVAAGDGAGAGGFRTARVARRSRRVARIVEADSRLLGGAARDRVRAQCAVRGDRDGHLDGADDAWSPRSPNRRRAPPA